MTSLSGFTIYTDGAARGNPGPAAAAFLVLENGKIVHKHSSFLGTQTNNQAEYQAIISALKNTKQFTKKHIQIYSDSELIVKQLNGEFQVKSPRLRGLYQEVITRIRDYSSVEFFHVPRTNPWIKKVDKLCNEELDRRRIIKSS